MNSRISFGAVNVSSSFSAFELLTRFDTGQRCSTPDLPLKISSTRS
jgi:hypothetical protein